MTPTVNGRVFVIAQPSIKRDGSYPDLDPLKAHGDVIFVIPNTARPSDEPAEALDLVREQLENFDPVYDKLAWAGGDMLSAIMVGAVLQEYEIDSFWFLRYNRHRSRETGKRLQTGYYTPVRISLLDGVPDPRQGSMQL